MLPDALFFVPVLKIRRPRGFAKVLSSMKSEEIHAVHCDKGMRIMNQDKKNSKGPGCFTIFISVFVLMPLLTLLLLVAFIFFAVLLYQNVVLGLLGLAFSGLAIWTAIRKIKRYNHKKDVKMSAEKENTDEVSEIALRPKDGKYPEDYIKRLEADQIARMAENAHYNIVVIDFETTGLSPKNDEILQVSIIDEAENVLINQMCKPTHTKSWEGAWSVNGIYPGDVCFCPPFADVAPYVRDILERSDLVLAYNYPFEPNFLRANGIDPEQLTWGPDPMHEIVQYCNVMQNRSLQKMSLQWAADIIGYKYNPHDAVEDVKATLHVYNFTQEHLAETQALLQARTEEEAKRAKEEAERKARRGRVMYPENKNADPRHPLFGKTIVITGQLPIDRDEASKKAASLGAKVRLQVSPRTQILVCGQREDEWKEIYGEKSYKIKKVEQMNLEGANVELMSGQRFMELLEQPAEET